MSSFLSPFANGAEGSSQGQQQEPYRSYSGMSLQGLDIEMGNTSLDDDGSAAAQQPQRTFGAAHAMANQQDANMEGSSINVPSPAQCPTQPFPTSVKRKRYSVSLDYPANDISLNLPKVRTNRNPQAIPPEIGQYLDTDFTSLPPALQATLISAISARATTQRKTTARIIHSLTPKPEPPKFDIISKISGSIDILANVAKYLRPRDIVNLYSISRAFHTTLDGNMQSTIIKAANYICPLPAQIFPYHFYTSCSVPDPVGRPRDPAYHDIFARLSAAPSLPAAHLPNPDGKTRRIPSLVWLLMIHSRHTRVRDIMASLARQGHRLPRGTYATLLKIWLIMDLPSNADRATVIKTRKYFTRFDLYRASLFLVKMCLRMNDPLYGPDHMELLKLMLGQRGLSPLWKLLRGKGYDTYIEILQLKMRYNVQPTRSQLEYGRPICGVPVQEMGRTHLEGWGTGASEHLLRPDELVVREAARRELAIEPHLEGMMIYGHVDVDKGLDLVPKLEELYMSDEECPEVLPAEECDPHHVVSMHGAGNVPFGDHEWTPKLARKAVWDELTDRERELIMEDDKDEMLKSLVWEMDSEDTLEEDSDEDEEDESEEENVEDGDEHSSDKENMTPSQDIQPGIPRVIIQDSDLDDSYSITSSMPDISSSPEYPSAGLQPPSPQDRRVFSTDSLMFPQLEGSSRVTSMASDRLMTPHMGPSVGVHIQDADYPMSEVPDLDLDGEESTIMAESSLNPTPRKGVPSSQLGVESEGDGDDEFEEDGDGGGDEEDDDDEEDEELRAQGYESYDESEFEYDWDGFMEEYQWEKEAQAGHDEGEAEERLRQYQRRY